MIAFVIDDSLGADVAIGGRLCDSGLVDPSYSLLFLRVKNQDTQMNLSGHQLTDRFRQHRVLHARRNREIKRTIWVRLSEQGSVDHKLPTYDCTAFVFPAPSSFSLAPTSTS
jgi:hypothetical protein